MSGHMDQYRRLTVNTAILMIGTMGSRIITFLMLPFYTNILSTGEYGTIDLLLQISNFLGPVCTLGVNAGIIRFGLDNQYDKKDVFTTGLLCFSAGLALCLILVLCANILPVPDNIVQYGLWMLTLVAASSLHAICGTFVRARERVRIYAITGILNTICNVLLMVLFLKYMNLGVKGYMLAVTLADIFSILFLAFSSKLWEFVGFNKLRISTTKEIVKFSVPTIPATISWWIMDMSDRLMITAFISVGANGIYSVAAKIPSIVTILAGVFIDAWQISIIGTKSKEERSRFYSNIMRSYEAILFVMAGFVTLFSRFLISFLTAPDYYRASEYVPLLISATVFSCLATFVGNIYTVAKKSLSQLTTTMIGAVTNILLNWILIPRFGIFGAVIATVFSFMLLFVIRMIDTRKYMEFHWSPLRFGASLILLAVQNLAMMSGRGAVYVIQVVCLAGLVAVNYKPLMAGLKKVIAFKNG